MFREWRKRAICVGLVLFALSCIGWRGYCADVPFGGEQYLIGAVAAYPADLDRDGDMDLVVPSARVGGEIYSLVWLENDGGVMPQFTRHDILTSSTVPFGSVAVADLDGDGWPDFGAGDPIGSGRRVVRERWRDPSGFFRRAIGRRPMRKKLPRSPARI